ncbi:ROK family protein [Spirosoma luteum]|uniref:ROK family protein n=1 Tax=Spirosoma luteum TaxID=431553 RepID=UPI00036DA8B5|nr:ROK family protein [Spirosoma luteum]
MNLGIETGGTKLQLVTDNMTGQLTQRFRYTVDPTQGAAGILAQIETTVRQLPELPQAIGVGFGGPVDWQSGRIAASHQVGGWSDFDLTDWLHDLAPGALIRVENDANVAALGEARQGVAKGFGTVFYMTLGSGVGGGLVVNQHIYHGAVPGEAEVGHLWLVPPSADSPGQTIEQTVSGWAVDKQIRELLPQLPPDSALRLAVQQAHGQGLAGGEARFLHQAYEASDPVARMLIEQVGSVIALGLSHVVHLFHPDVIVLGGGLSLIGEPLRAAVRQALLRYVMPSFGNLPVILLSKLGEDAVPVGALELLMNVK